jgi:hypothetical protein
MLSLASLVNLDTVGYTPVTDNMAELLLFNLPQNVTLNGTFLLHINIAIVGRMVNKFTES